MTAAPPVTAEVMSEPGPHVVVRGRPIPVVLPKLSDPRLKLSATIITLTILGLTVLNFQVSIPQILVCILLSAVVEIVVTYRREHVLVWPASAIQTGVSVAFIFRVGGTQHADYWSLRGLHLFVFVTLLSLLPKYLIRRNGRHIFNPSNIGLAWGLLLIGPHYVFSEHLWWAPLGAPVLISMAVIFGGAFWILRQVRMIPMAVTFLATFLTLIAFFALAGRSYYATWHNGPVGGSFYWLTIALSPELLIFVFFMITDPQTAPKSPLGRKIYAVATAFVAAGLILIQPTEFGIKVAILSSLLLTCALVPAIEQLATRIEERRSGAGSLPRPAPEPVARRLAAAVRSPVLVAATIIAVGGVIDTALLARDDNITYIEREMTPRAVQ
ncbi:MAG TPA: RnfABCDGE type electron transport complex subunit D [Acidimicrobiales bacterium]|nr:RnfABCDGE type electron transport complex subunit D [Acidimicrobiales bacterium]